ncbi:MAG: hypothetical protein R3274_04925 [Desulfobacterales bacterium]|nr:hypothetical protein [Desulfobacterales bacterium]
MYLIDVSGHGVGTALLSVSVMNVLRRKKDHHPGIHEQIPGLEYAINPALGFGFNHPFIKPKNQSASRQDLGILGAAPEKHMDRVAKLLLGIFLTVLIYVAYIYGRLSKKS